MRYCQTLELKDNPLLIEEYKEWHSTGKIWKEIPDGIRKAGIKEMEIYLWENRLFMIVDVEDTFAWDRQMEILSELPRQKEWESFMDEFQQRPEKGDKSRKWQRMEKIFKLTDCK